MASEAAEILASALEQDASAQESGRLEIEDQRIEAVRQEVRPINDIPRPIFKLALRFWREWAQASRLGLDDYGLIAASDWPVMARTIAQHVRSGSMPPDRMIIENFVRRRRPSRWRGLGRLFGDSTRSTRNGG